MVLQKLLINADDVCMVVDANCLVSTGENGSRERTDEVGERSWAFEQVWCYIPGWINHGIKV